MQVVISADAPKALVELCGVSLLQRWLRILQRLGLREVTIVSTTPEQIRPAIESRSWACREISARMATEPPNELSLVLRGDFYCDPRLVRALLAAGPGAELIDSNPPEFVRPLLPASSEIAAAVAVDAASVPSYIRGMRRSIRPVFFPAPPPELRAQAERIIFDTAQNGTLDIPAICHSPLETWIMRWLCRTSITPNQISAFGLLVGALAAALFASGRLWLGIIPALALGVIDGLDGKQARVKIETTSSGKSEHVLDSFVEVSWWAALAFWFWRSGQLPYAWILFAVIVGAEAIDQLAKQIAHRHIDRLLDDHSPFDRFVRRIGARRDIYVWALAIALLVGAPARTYELCAWWGAITAIVHGIRAAMLATAR